jgi:hypothetical protein
LSPDFVGAVFGLVLRYANGRFGASWRPRLDFASGLAGREYGLENAPGFFTGESFVTRLTFALVVRCGRGLRAGGGALVSSMGGG